MTRTRYDLPPGKTGTSYRVDSAAAFDSPADVAPGTSGPSIAGSTLQADPVTGALPTIWGPDGAAGVLYLKELRYDGVPTGTVITVAAATASQVDPGVSAGHRSAAFAAQAAALAPRALSSALAAERVATAMPTVTTASAQPTATPTAHYAATGAGGTPLLGALNTAEIAFAGGKYMKAAAAAPRYNGARKVPRPVSPQGFGDGVYLIDTDAPVLAFQQILTEGGGLRVFADGIEVYRCGPTIRAGTAQAGTTNTITLDTGASSVNGFYNTRWIRITSGTGAGQARQIGSYVGSTKVATLSGTWATAPDATSVFEVAAGRRDNSTSSGNGWGVIDWAGDRRMRSYRVECSATTFLGVWTSAVDTVLPGIPPGAVPTAWLGDSFGAGVGGDIGIGMAHVACAQLGWELINLSIGGTGYLNAGASSLTFYDRVLPPVNAWWVGGGYGSSAGTLTLSYGGATTVAIAYNASISAIQAAVDAAFGSGVFTVHGDSANNFYLLGRGRAAGSTSPVTASFSITGGAPFITHWDGDMAPVVPTDAAGNELPFNIVLAGGHNDTTSTNAAYTSPVLTAAVSALLTGITARWKTARVFVIGSMYLPGSPVGGDVTAAAAAIYAACLAGLPRFNGVLPYVDTIGALPGNSPWFTGTGRIGAPAGTGNSDIATDTDNVHPAPGGVLIYGRRIAREFAQLLSRLVNPS